LVPCMLPLQFEIELQAFLHTVPPQGQRRFVDVLRSNVGSLDGWERLSLLRAMIRRVRGAGGIPRSIDSEDSGPG
jgi:hypothetical protein